MREGAFEEGGLETQEGLLEFEALLAELDLDVASVVVWEERLQLLAGVRKTDLYLFVHHYMIIGGKEAEHGGSGEFCKKNKECMKGKEANELVDLRLGIVNEFYMSDSCEPA